MDSCRHCDSVPEGKVPPDVLREILALPAISCEDLVVPPTPGEDGAVMRWQGDFLVVGSDPITFRTPRPGHFAVCVNANDLAAMGARPRFFTVTLMVPRGSSRSELVGIMRDVVDTSNALGIVLAGGHTEVTAAVNWPVLSVTMFGELVGDVPLRTGGAQAGDLVLQVNPLGIEGTAILAEERIDALSAALGSAAVQEARRLLDSPGILVMEPALTLAAEVGVHALHDPTEGGLATGLREMAEAASLGVRVDESALIMRTVTADICACVDIDPLGLISSGCLLAAVSASVADHCISTLNQQGYEAAVIGEFTTAPDVISVGADGQTVPLRRFSVDELAKT